jgi:hypothetical protein
MAENHTSVSLSSEARRSKAMRILRQAARLEPLEQRRMLATVEGNVWNDADNDSLRDFFEDPIEGLTIFIDANKNAALDEGEQSTVSDENGFYRFTDLPVVPFNPEEGTGGTAYNIAHLPFLDQAQTQPISQTSPGVAGKSNIQSLFNIDIIYADNSLNDEQKTLVETAVGRWEQAVLSELPDAGEIDDLQITVIGAGVDGPGGVLAFAGPRAFRAPQPDGKPGLPITGEITIDLVDAVASRGFVDVVVHEIGHVMGIGTIWDQFLVNRGSPGVAYVGDNGVEEYGRLFGTSASSVPVQAQVEGHWDPIQLANELMNPFSAGGFELPADADPLLRFSRLTIGALEDFGFAVNYAAADTYGPFNIGPLPEDFKPDLGFVPFQITAFLETEDDIVDDANFGVRFNEPPRPFYLTAGPLLAAPGQGVRLLVELDTLADPKFDGDNDYRDSVAQVNFYQETNGLPGVQTSVDVARGLATSADLLLFEDADATDGYEFTVDSTGQGVGDQLYYARVFDEGYFPRDRLVNVTFVPIQSVPAKPGSIQAIGLDRDTILVNWIDNSTNENGFLLQVSRSPNFDVPDDITNFYLPAQEGTGVYSHEHFVFEGELNTRYFRVRSFNTGGSSPFAGRVTARTLSRNEVLVDNESFGKVRNLGNWETIFDRANSTNLTYLRGTSGFVEYDPQVPAVGDYFVFLRNPNTTEAGRITVSVFSNSGALLGSVEVDQAASRGSDVQIGRFRLGPESFVRIEHLSGAARADTVRFLPVS